MVLCIHIPQIRSPWNMEVPVLHSGSSLDNSFRLLSLYSVFPLLSLSPISTARILESL